MRRAIPPELNTRINQRALKWLEGSSAHSDVVEALAEALKPLGDVQLFCPDPQQYLYLIASTKDVIFAFAAGMNTVCFRLDELMRGRALASGAASHPGCGNEWVSFALFRDDWPKADLEFWARKAYVTARGLQQ